MSIRDKYESIVKRKHINMLLLCCTIALVMIILIVLAIVSFPSLDDWMLALVQRHGLIVCAWPAGLILLAVFVAKLIRRG